METIEKLFKHCVEHGIDCKNCELSNGDECLMQGAPCNWMLDKIKIAIKRIEINNLSKYCNNEKM